MYYPCKDPKTCGVKRHRSSTVNPACGAGVRSATAKSTSSLASAPPPSVATKIAPQRRAPSDFSVSRSVTSSGGTKWEFPVSFRGAKRAVSVSRERNHSMLSVRVSEPDGQVEANVFPLDARGSTPGGFLVSMDAGDGRHAAVYTVRPKESPVDAEVYADRLELLSRDSNWIVSGAPSLKHVDAQEGESLSLPPSEDRALAAAKAVRLYGILTAAHSSSARSRAMTSYDEQGLEKMSATVRADDEIREALARAGLSLKAQMV